MFGLFKGKTKGCLHGKTYQQKVDYFKSLYNFAITDPGFFAEQYTDLQAHEKREFEKWLKRENELKQIMKHMVDVLSGLLEQKHNK